MKSLKEYITEFVNINNISHVSPKLFDIYKSPYKDCYVKLTDPIKDINVFFPKKSDNESALELLKPYIDDNLTIFIRPVEDVKFRFYSAGKNIINDFIKLNIQIMPEDFTVEFWKDHNWNTI